MPVPRGGVVVAGLLSYLVPLHPGQFDAPSDDAPVLIIDDVALTGQRLAGVLRAHHGRAAVVATLCAAAPLVAALPEAYPNVGRFLTARELADRTPVADEAAAEAFRRQWAGDGVVWVGRCEQVAFAWAEPESEATNPVTGEPSSGWKLTAPARCLGNRRTDDQTPAVLPDVAATCGPRLAGGWVVAVDDEPP